MARGLLMVAAVTVTLACTRPARAQDAPVPVPVPVAIALAIAIASVPPLEGAIFGDWGGLKPWIAERGVTVRAVATLNVANNAQGGDRDLMRQAGEVSFFATVDTRKSIGLPGGTLKALITRREGRELSIDADMADPTVAARIAVFGLADRPGSRPIASFVEPVSRSSP